VDRRAIAREQRRRQAAEALEFERERGRALQEQLESVVADLDGAELDQAVFASMAPEDVAVVREAIYGPEPDEPPEPDEWAGDWHPQDEEEPADDPAEQEAEIDRLREEIASSVERQRAFERYLEALGEA
jgi:hypothetical protein